MCILTIAVPIFNMEWCLEKNLATYDDPRLIGRVEVICLNNASEDGSKAIIERFAAARPEIFRLIDRDSRGYGSSINAALAAAKGKYFRIVDADDWVNTEDLVKLTGILEDCRADVVQTDYEIVDMQTGAMTPVRAGDKGAAYGVIYTDFDVLRRTFPMIHSTGYRTGLLREAGFQLQDNTFYVDEEYVLLPMLRAGSVLFLDLDIYRYMVANPGQSSSPGNRSKRQDHQERVIRRIAGEFLSEAERNPQNPVLPYVRFRLMKLLGDRFTVLLIYVEDRKKGRALAKAWEAYIRETLPDFWPEVGRKARLLYAMNALHVSLPMYARLKKAVFKK